MAVNATTRGPVAAPARHARKDKCFGFRPDFPEVGPGGTGVTAIGWRRLRGVANLAPNSRRGGPRCRLND